MTSRSGCVVSVARQLGFPKQLIAIWLSPHLLVALCTMAEKEGKGYQTLIHELLEKAASRAA
jgi:predicted DNA binding CopG/RHH family protein